MSKDDLQEIEVKVAFLEDALTKLSDEHYQQQKQLEKLKSGYARLAEKVMGGGDDSAEPLLDDEKPPHY